MEFLNNSNSQGEENFNEGEELEDLFLDSLISNCDFSDDSNFKSNVETSNTNFINYPCNRGGHAMTIDEEKSRIYIFGGWNGTEDLDDFWMFDILKDEWKLISNSTGKQKGPSARSCHRMVFDNNKRRIYIYGRIKKVQENKNNKLYEYDVEKEIWIVHELLNKYDKVTDSIVNGGPGQVYDHQMCIDSVNQKLFIFGGTCLTEVNNDSGRIYCYIIILFFYLFSIIF